MSKHIITDYIKEFTHKNGDKIKIVSEQVFDDYRNFLGGSKEISML